MDGDAILGCILIAGALLTLTALTLWSRRTIRRIREGGSGSLREIMKGLNGE